MKELKLTFRQEWFDRKSGSIFVEMGPFGVENPPIDKVIMRSPYTDRVIHFFLDSITRPFSNPERTAFAVYKNTAQLAYPVVLFHDN